MKKNKENAKRDEIVNYGVNDSFNVSNVHNSVEVDDNVQPLQISVRSSNNTESFDLDFPYKDGRLVLVDYRLMKMYEIKRQAGFSHILTTLVQSNDKSY